MAHGDVAQREGQINSARGVRVWGPAREWGQKRRRRKRTSNMPLMSVTLEVSKLSGWLKAAPPYCRVQKGASGRGRRVWHTETWHRGKGESAAHAACMRVWGGPAREWGQKAQAEAHREHSAHVCDAGGVKAQRLVESIRTLRSPKGGIRQRDDACGTEMWHRGKGESAAHAACVCGRARDRAGRRRRRKRTWNM